MDESDFRKKLEETLKDFENRVWPLADQYGFEVDTGGGMVQLIFEDPAPSRFILSPQTPARQIWLSALVGSYKFDWDPQLGLFVLDKTREPFLGVLSRLLKQQLKTDIQL